MTTLSAESVRLVEDAHREKNWKRWGTYLPERQWGTVREDYSANGECWDYLPHDHARSRAYRWGEDGLFGLCDRECRLCLAPALWNGRDPILKERLFGLSGPEGNHGEDVKECYFYLDATPTCSYARALYKYPQRAYPYENLVEENRRRGRSQPEYELIDTGVFDDGRYFDVTVEYAKAEPEDVLVVYTIDNCGPEAADLVLLPTLWFRNTWSWGREGEGYWQKPRLSSDAPGELLAEHATLGPMRLHCEPTASGAPQLLFTENETNYARLFGVDNPSPFVKDAFHEHLIGGHGSAVNHENFGTKAAALYRLRVPGGGSCRVRLRLCPDEALERPPFDDAFEQVLGARKREADEFYAECLPPRLSAEETRVARQAYAGLLWNKQFYYYVPRDWLEGDAAFPAPPPSRLTGRNSTWTHLYNRDVISMPDKWEYPWYAAWDLAFHMVPLSALDVEFAKSQLVLFLREWYMHPNGQIPAYEFAFSDVNPPVHAWAALHVYERTKQIGKPDRHFLERVFQKLLLNFTWWVNRTDDEGNNLFAGGFLGLDNIGVFDRSVTLPTGGHLEQADGTAWMAFYCATMLEIALELAREDAVYADLASKFFEHFVEIVDAMNDFGGTGLWDEQDGFYYDQLHVDGHALPLTTRSVVGVIPLYAVLVLDDALIDQLPGFKKRMQWFLDNRADLGRHIAYMQRGGVERGQRLLAVPSRERLARVLRYVLDESEFLSPFGVRSLSRVHLEHPYVFSALGVEHRVQYVPGESNTGMFGGNSNWRGPVWFPVNFLLVQALRRYHRFYGDTFRVECPTGSGKQVTLDEVADEIAKRLTKLFVPDEHGVRPGYGPERRFATDERFRDHVAFYEHFHGDNGRGLGASHQTGWTALIATCLEELALRRSPAR
jgi:Mannosylglycerate hydrolase MGH1-like glycoside hydrolase domain